MTEFPSAPRNEGEGLKQLVRQLGGPTIVARALGSSCEAVCMWFPRGEVPRAHRLDFWVLCASKGIAWCPPGFEHFRLVEASGEASNSANAFATISTSQDAAA